MRLVLLVEGWTEKELPAFLKRWLDPQLPRPIGIHAVRLPGAPNFVNNVAKRVRSHLTHEEDTIAVFGLLDLYGLQLDYPKHADRDQKVSWARTQIMNRVEPIYRPKFRQHFAVHEIEAWLVTDPRLFPTIKLPDKCVQPEEIDFEEPPSKLLDRLFKEREHRRRHRGYDKTTMAANLFPRLDPTLVYQKCPNFKLLMDEMLDMARQALTA